MWTNQATSLTDIPQIPSHTPGPTNLHHCMKALHNQTTETTEQENSAAGFIFLRLVNRIPDFDLMQ